MLNGTSVRPTVGYTSDHHNERMGRCLKVVVVAWVVLKLLGSTRPSWMIVDDERW